MAAIIALHPHHQTAPGSGRRAERPQLRVIDGGRSRSGIALRRMYLRRRIAAVITSVVLVWLAVSALGAVAAAVTGSPAGAPAGAGAPAAASHVVRSGETLWSIAVGLGRGGDVRDTVDAIAEANGVDDLVPGQVLVIPPELLR
jgi:LysM repeat protein